MPPPGGRSSGRRQSLDEPVQQLDTLSVLRSAATERLRQALGADGLAKASPLDLAELANDILDGLVLSLVDP